MFNGYFNDDTSKRAWNNGMSVGFKLILWVIYTACLQYYLRLSPTISGIIGFLLAFAPGQVWSAALWTGTQAKNGVAFLLNALVSIVKTIASAFQNRSRGRKRRNRSH